jgi:hypothetical protein
MRRFLAAVLLLAASIPAARAQSTSPWQITVYDQSCNVTDPNVGACGSVAWVTNRDTPAIFVCKGIMRSRARPPQPVTLSVGCQSYNPTTSGPIAFAAPRATVMPCCDQNTAPNPFHQVYTDFVGYYWVIGRDIGDLRFCYTATKECSADPVVSALKAGEAEQPRAPSEPSPFPRLQ